MPSKFPNGFASGVSIRDIPVLNVNSNKAFWVDSNNGSNGNPGTVQQPFATIDYAIGKCTASRGDIIYVKEGHAETLATAGAIAMDVIGVKVIGCGVGNDRPTLSFSATAATITMSAASCTLANVVLLATVDSVVSAVVVSAAGCTVDVETRDTSAAVEFITGVLTTSAADNLTLNITHKGFAAGDASTSFIKLIGVDSASVNMDYFGIASTAVVQMLTTACNDIRVTGRFYNESVALTKNVVNSTTSTWSVKGYDAKGGYDFAGSDDTGVYNTTAGTSDATGAFIPGLGYRVTKTSNLADGSGTDNLFTVTGVVACTLLIGEVSTVIGGAATMKLRDITNSVDLCAATTIDTDAVGTRYLLTGVSAQILNGTGNAPVVGSVSGITGQTPNTVILGVTGTPLTIAHVLDAADTGNVLWTMYYQPLSSGATVAAAA